MRFVACKADVVQLLSLPFFSLLLAREPIRMRVAARWKTSHHIHLCATSVITIKIELAIFAHKCATQQQCHNAKQNKIDYYIRADMRTVWNANVCMQNIINAEAKGTRWASQFRFMTDWYIFRMDRHSRTHSHHWNYSVFNQWNINIIAKAEKTPFGRLFCLACRRGKNKRCMRHSLDLDKQR